MFNNPAFLAMYADARAVEHAIRAPRFAETPPRGRRLVPTFIRQKLVNMHKQTAVTAHKRAA